MVGIWKQRRGSQDGEKACWLVPPPNSVQMPDPRVLQIGGDQQVTFKLVELALAVCHGPVFKQVMFLVPQTVFTLLQGPLIISGE